MIRGSIREGVWRVAREREGVRGTGRRHGHDYIPVAPGEGGVYDDGSCTVGGGNAPGHSAQLIGTLMLVGLIPLAMSLIVILGGGAAMQLSRIRNNYESVAASCADRIADTLLRDELKGLTLAAHDPNTVAYVREQNRLRLAGGRRVITCRGRTFRHMARQENG